MFQSFGKKCLLHSREPFFPFQPIRGIFEIQNDFKCLSFGNRWKFTLSVQLGFPLLHPGATQVVPMLCNHISSTKYAYKNIFSIYILINFLRQPPIFFLFFFRVIVWKHCLFSKCTAMNSLCNGLEHRDDSTWEYTNDVSQKPEINCPYSRNGHSPSFYDNEKRFSIACRTFKWLLGFWISCLDVFLVLRIQMRIEGMVSNWDWRQIQRVTDFVII